MSEISTDAHPFGDDPFVRSYPELKTFWEAAAQGRLLLPICNACGRAHWYPRVVCPHCGDSNLGWRQSAGMGSVYSYSVVRRAEVPYVLAYVRLDDGPTLMTNIVDCDVDEVRIGQRVHVRFQPAAEGRPVPVFVPEGQKAEDA